MGQTLTLTVSANPANGVRTTQPQPAAVIEALDGGLTYGTAGLLPLGASFDAGSHTLTFTPRPRDACKVTFTLDDDVIPVSKTVKITVV